MKLGMAMGAALVIAPALAFAQQNHANQNQNQPTQNQGTQSQGTQNQAMPNQQPSTAQGNTQAQDATTQRLLPTDAKLVGAVESTDIRAFPEQMPKGQNSANIEKDAVVGVGGIDRVWTTKQSYKQAVSHFDQKLKSEGIAPIAKTTTQSSTAWNVRMPDGHVANVVVRNTQPTTIESVQAAAMLGTMTEQGNQQGTSGTHNQQPAPSSKTKSNDNKTTTIADRRNAGWRIPCGHRMSSCRRHSSARRSTRSTSTRRRSPTPSTNTVTASARTAPRSRRSSASTRKSETAGRRRNSADRRTRAPLEDEQARARARDRAQAALTEATMNEENEGRRIDELTERTVDDVAALAHKYAGVAKREMASAGERAAWPAAAAAIGAVLAVVGSGMLVASPAVPSAQRRLKRRMRFAALAYVTLGLAALVVGGGALVATIRRALPRTRRNLHEAVDVVRERI